MKPSNLKEINDLFSQKHNSQRENISNLQQFPLKDMSNNFLLSMFNSLLQFLQKLPSDEIFIKSKKKITASSYFEEKETKTKSVLLYLFLFFVTFCGLIIYLTDKLNTRPAPQNTYIYQQYNIENQFNNKETINSLNKSVKKKKK